MVALYFMYYNFGRVHQTLRVTPAMEAGIVESTGRSRKLWHSWIEDFMTREYNIGVGLSLGLCFGAALGAALHNLGVGTAMPNVSVGMALGASLGTVFGASLGSIRRGIDPQEGGI